MVKKLKFIFIFLIISGVITLSMVIMANHRLSNSQAELINMRSKADTSMLSKTEQSQKIAKEISGLSHERVKKDRDIAKKFFERYLTWDSWKSYETNRQEILKDRRVDKTFIDVVAPEVKSVVKDGKDFNDIDNQGLNMGFTGIKVSVTGIRGTTYSYLSEVSVHSKSRTGRKATGKIVSTYEVNGSGEINKVKAFTVAE